MSVTPELFNALFTQLRSPFGVNIALVSEQLGNLYKSVSSIFPLITFLELSADPILRQHAILGIISCLNQLKNNPPNSKEITMDALLYIEAHVLAVLRCETAPVVRRSIVRLILHILDEYPSIDWGDMHSMILQHMFQLDSAFPILSHLIYRISREQVLRDIPFFHQLLLAGFSSDCFEVVSYAVSFLISLVGNLRSDEFFIHYKEVLLELLRKVAPLGDSQKFSKLAAPLVSGFENGVSLVPFYSLLSDFYPVIRCDQLDIEYRLQLHSFLASTFIFNRDVDLPEKDIQNIFDLEIYLCFQVFQLDEADPTMNWLFDIDLMLHELFYRILDNAVIITTNKMKELISFNNDTSKAIAILLLDNSIDCANDNFSDFTLSSFNFLVEALKETGSESQRMAVRLLLNHSGIFEDEIDQNLMEVISIIIVFMKQVDANTGSLLLLRVIEQATSTDLVFGQLMNLSSEMIQYPDAQVQYYATQIMSTIIAQSSDITPALFNKLLQNALSIVSFESPQSSIFSVLSSLCCVDSSQFLPALQILMPMILNALSLDDPYPVSDVVSFLNTAFIEISESMNYAENLFPLLILIAEKMWPPETYKGSAVALEVMARIVIAAPTQNCAEVTIKIMLNFCENGLFVPAFKILEMMANYVPPPICEKLIGYCLKQIETSDETELVVNALYALNSMPSLLGNEERFIRAMIKIITTTINPLTKAIQFDESIDSAISEILPAVVCRSKILFPDTINLLLGKMKSGGNSTVFAFQALSEFFMAVPELIPENIQNDILTFIMNVLSKSDQKLVEAASCVISLSCSLRVFSYAALDIVNGIAYRILQEPQPSSLTDHLVAAITSLSGQVLGDRFPFDTVLPIILKVLPAVHSVQLADDIYPFIANISRIANQQMMMEILRVFINVIARPYQNILALQMSKKAIISIISTLKQCLPNNDSRNDIISTCLDNDQTKINLFNVSYQRATEEVDNTLM